MATTGVRRKVAEVPEGARLVLRPAGYIARRPSRADDLSIVNGARASFARHKSDLGPEDIMTPEEADAWNRANPDADRPARAGLVYRLLGAGHETPAEQHGLLVHVKDAPVEIRNLVSDEIDARHEGDRVSFPWTLNLRHAMTLHRRTMRRGDELTRIGAQLLLRFHEAGCEHGVSAYLRNLGQTVDDLRAQAGDGEWAVTTVANPGTEPAALAAIRRHLGDEVNQMTDGELVRHAWTHHPNLLNLWVFTWQLRAPIHVFWDLVRHRKSSPNGESGRYSVLYDDWIELAEDEVRTQKGSPLSYERGTAPPEMAREFIDDLNRFNQLGVDMYYKWVDRKVAREMCSWFEGLAKMRTFVWTFRGLGLVNMVGLRNHETTLKELRLYAAEIEDDIRKEAPLLWETFDEIGKRKAP